MNTPIKENNLQANLEVLRLFFDNTILDVTNPQIVSLNTSLVKEEPSFKVTCDAISTDKNLVVVIIDDSKCSKFRKFINLLVRRGIHRKCEQMLLNKDFQKIESYALYPSVERLSVAYPINTSAAIYAEKYIFNEAITLHKRILFLIFRALKVVSPNVDVIAIVGFRQC